MKPNWRLIAVVGGAAATLALVVVMFVATSQGTHGTGLPTTTALSSVPSKAVEKSLDVTIGSNGCAFVDVDGTKSLAIWPEGYRQDDSGNVIAPDGTTYAQGDSVTASTVVTTRAAVLKLSGGGDDDYLGLLLTQCQGSDTHVAILSSITG